MGSGTQKIVLSTADVARLFNVTETTVKRWADEGTLKCQKTPGGHRKYDVRCVVEFAESNNFEPVGALTIPEADRLGPRIQAAVLDRDFAALVEAFVEKALSPDPGELFVFLSYLYQHRIHLWEIHDLLVRPGMEEIGRRWAAGAISVCHEHRASHETLEALVKLQTQIRIRSQNGHSVVCSCLGDELHEIGLRCAAHMFESEGWTTTYLGARTPVEALTSTIRELRPTVVSLSITYVPAEGLPEAELRRIVEAAQEARAQIILGGRGAHALRRNGAATGSSTGGVITSSRGLLTFMESFA
jgi:methanogenic corrinoid protein MtbC1